MNTYTVEQSTAAGWREVLNLKASGSGSALRQADVKFPAFAGKHRARLISSALRPAPLCADDRNFIHRLTTQAI